MTLEVTTPTNNPVLRITTKASNGVIFPSVTGAIASFNDASATQLVLNLVGRMGFHHALAQYTVMLLHTTIIIHTSIYTTTKKINNNNKI